MRHIAWDIGIAGVAETLSKHLDAHLIAQRYSRLVIDCNRPPDVASSIPRISEATTIPGNEGLSREAAAMRRAQIFDPYHRRIDEIIDQRGSAGMPTVLVSLHSFTPVYAGIARPWHIGTLYQRDTDLPPLLLKRCAPRAISWSATTSPMRSATRPTTPFPCTAKRAG